MSIKKLCMFLSCAAIFCFTFSASIVIAQAVNQGKALLSDALFPKGIAGEWRLNDAASDDVIAKMREALQRRNDAPKDDAAEAAKAGLHAISISIFPADTLILETGGESEVTIKELFADVIETRKMLSDGSRREFEIASGAKASVTATRKGDLLSVETVSPRGNKMIETFALAPGCSRLIGTLRIENSRAQDVLTLRRVYERFITRQQFILNYAGENKRMITGRRQLNFERGRKPDSTSAGVQIRCLNARRVYHRHETSSDVQLFVRSFLEPASIKILIKEKNRMAKECQHIGSIKNPRPNTPNGCEECIKMGDDWVHLRLCEECGHVGCCDNSKNKHATKHFHSTKHPIIKSFQPGEDWGWCYVDEVTFDPFPDAAN